MASVGDKWIGLMPSQMGPSEWAPEMASCGRGSWAPCGSVWAPDIRKVMTAPDTIVLAVGVCHALRNTANPNEFLRERERDRREA